MIPGRIFLGGILMRHCLALLFVLLASLVVSLVASSPVAALTFDIETELAGRFLSDGSAENDPSFQNYFVGHTAMAGDPFPYVEQRNFFIFDLPVTGEVIVSATLTLHLAPGSLFTDEAPGVPEIYELTSVPFPAIEVADVTNTPGENLPIYDSLGMSTPYASVPVLPADIPPGVPGDPNVDLVIPLSGLAVDDMNFAGAGLFSMGGRMGTHSFDSPAELDEIMFAFTDVEPTGFSLVPKPVLTIVTVPIPEPGTAVLLGLGLAGLAKRSRRG